MFLLDPYAPGRPMKTLYGGGLNGAGFGIAIDPLQRIWVGNFGFTGSLCPEHADLEQRVGVPSERQTDVG